MNKLKILLILFIVLNVNILTARVYKSAVKQKVLKYLKQNNINIKLNDIKIESPLPNYKLYEISIRNFKNNKVEVIIYNFFDPTDKTTLFCKIINPDIRNVYPINSKVKIIYKMNNIEIIDIGKICGKSNNFYIIENSFGKKVKCIPIKNNLFKVIE